jgi:hypothetical protein
MKFMRRHKTAKYLDALRIHVDPDYVLATLSKITMQQTIIAETLRGERPIRATQVQNFFAAAEPDNPGIPIG